MARVIGGCDMVKLGQGIRVLLPALMFRGKFDEGGT